MVCFLFQFFCSVQEFEAVLAIEMQHVLLVVCIHDDKTTSRLVVRVYEPGGYVFYDLRTYRISAALEIFLRVVINVSKDVNFLRCSAFTRN